FDPDAPWDQMGGKNPHTIASVAPGYIRPIAGVVLGPDGQLYSGWEAKYGVYGGAVAITDPASGKTQTIENPLGEQAVSGVAIGEFLYVGTSLDGNGLPHKSGEFARFGVLDKTTHKVLFKHEFPGASNVSHLLFDQTAKRLAMAVDGQLKLFTTEGNAFTDLSAPGVGTSI